MGRFSHSGRWLVPGIERGSSGGEVRKSERVGPASRASEKAVLVWRWQRTLPLCSGVVLLSFPGLEGIGLRAALLGVVLW